MKSDKDLDGRLVYLTIHTDEWLRQVNSNFNVPMANRIAKIVKVFDWETEEGKLLLRVRKAQGKWDNMDSKAFKFVLRVYCPDLTHNGKNGITTEEMLPRFFPGSKLKMFELLPPWMLRSLQKEEKNVFSIVASEEQQVSGRKKSPVKKPAKKSTKKSVRVKKSQGGQTDVS